MCLCTDVPYLRIRTALNIPQTLMWGEIIISGHVNL